MRVGHGFDAHRFIAGRPLVLGGVHIPYPMGLEAHSDGDVLIHALCDALLGAAALGDIGKHFPNNDKQYKNIDSRVLLRHVVKLIQARGFRAGNADITVLAQQPKIMPYASPMIACLSQDLAIDPSSLNIKATTTEGMGYTGRGEGIAVHAVALLLIA